MYEIVRRVKSMNPYLTLFISYCILFIIYQVILNSFKEFITFDLLSYTILLIIIILPLFPHINEIKIGFLSITKKLDEFKQDVDERLLLLQNTVITSINQKQEQHLHIDTGASEWDSHKRAINNDEVKRSMEK
ncbi:MAG: hypothetical protein U9Q68_00420 [Euryarchaeota archaeon]|nr:hypothetical protein [Euryarchaeota archaeon]